MWIVNFKLAPRLAALLEIGSLLDQTYAISSLFLFYFEHISTRFALPLQDHLSLNLIHEPIEYIRMYIHSHCSNEHVKPNPNGIESEDFDPANVDRVIQYLRQVVEDTEDVMMWDPNYPSFILQKAAKALAPGLPAPEVFAIAEATREGLRVEHENSPYPEVRACVDAFDDTTIPVMTFRMWVIGLVLGVLVSAFNQFFLARKPGFELSATVAQLFAFPLGCLMAKVLPTRVFRFGRRSFTFNPGPFNIKEHVLISIMVSASDSAYATSIIAVLRAKPFYNDDRLSTKVGFKLMLLMSTQLMGYALAGLTRSFLVYYREMVWWEVIPQITILRALHGKDSQLYVKGWKITQMRFFFVCTVVSGIYFILPGVFFESLSMFNWTTWIAPNHVKLALITGTISGLGLNPVPTLNWNFMMCDPIITPLWSITNEYMGALGALVAISILYFKNVSFTAYLPINSDALYDRYGHRYNASKVLNEFGSFDQSKYKDYSPPFISAAGIVMYTGFFALYSSVVVYSVLHHRKYILEGISHYMPSWTNNLKGFKGHHKMKTKKEPKYLKDIHYRLMQAYPGVPNSWFVMIGIISIAMAIFMDEFYNTQLTIWGLCLSLFMSLVFIIPFGILQATAFIYIPLNVLAELVAGYLFAGRPLSNMLFKAYSYLTVKQALLLSADLKLAHYIKVPPRAVFACQTISTVISAIVSMAVLDWQIGAFPDLCSPDQPQHLTCRVYRQIFSSSVIYGAVGPFRLFTHKGSLYNRCLYGFLVGAILPLIPWMASRRWPRSNWAYVHTPVILSGMFCFPTLNLGYITPTMTVALFFQGYVKRWYRLWYEKYAVVFGSAIPAGISIFGMIYFFAFKMNGHIYEWAGNTIYEKGCDAQGCTLKKIPAGGFGPKTWQ